jgi:hypothetical protein
MAKSPISWWSRRPRRGHTGSSSGSTGVCSTSSTIPSVGTAAPSISPTRPTARRHVTPGQSRIETRWHGSRHGRLGGLTPCGCRSSCHAATPCQTSAGDVLGSPWRTPGVTAPLPRSRIVSSLTFHIPPNYVVEDAITHRKPPEVRIWRLGSAIQVMLTGRCHCATR